MKSLISIKYPLAFAPPRGILVSPRKMTNFERKEKGRENLANFISKICLDSFRGEEIIINNFLEENFIVFGDKYIFVYIYSKRSGSKGVPYKFNYNQNTNDFQSFSRFLFNRNPCFGLRIVKLLRKKKNDKKALTNQKKICRVNS